MVLYFKVQQTSYRDIFCRLFVWLHGGISYCAHNWSFHFCVWPVFWGFWCWNVVGCMNKWHMLKSHWIWIFILFKAGFTDMSLFFSLAFGICQLESIMIEQSPFDVVELSSEQCFMCQWLNYIGCISYFDFLWQQHNTCFLSILIFLCMNTYEGFTLRFYGNN